MANRSTFPQSIDTFLEHYDIQAHERASVLRYQALKTKATLTSSEQTELAELTALLRNKLFSPEDFNKLQDCITNLETFFRDNVEGYIATKQGELDVSIVNAKNSIDSTKDNALILIEQKKANIIEYIDSTTAGAIRNDMGDLLELETNTKLSLVEAINEVLSKQLDGGIF